MDTTKYMQSSYVTFSYLKITSKFKNYYFRAVGHL